MQTPRIPPQVYRPRDFTREVKQIEQKCFRVQMYGPGYWQDANGNVFKIDFADCSIAVN